MFSKFLTVIERGTNKEREKARNHSLVHIGFVALSAEMA